MTVDLCVVSYNTKELLERLIDTLYKDGPSDSWNLFVTDNGSTDGSAEYLEDLATETDKIQLLMLNGNIGYSAACNQMAAQGTGDLICLLNSDVWFESKEIDRAIKFFDLYQDAAIMGPKQRDEQGFIRHAGIVGTNSQPAHRGWRENDPHDILYRDTLECVTVSGSAYFVRRSVWNELANCPLYKGVVHNDNAVGAFLPTPHYY